jgi:hypothetical protein
LHALLPFERKTVSKGLLFFRLKFNGKAKRWRLESTISVYQLAHPARSCTFVTRRIVGG